MLVSTSGMSARGSSTRLIAGSTVADHEDRPVNRCGYRRAQRVHRDGLLEREATRLHLAG